MPTAYLCWGRRPRLHQLLFVVVACHRLDLRLLPCGFLLCLHLFTTQAWGMSRAFSPDFCPPPPHFPSPSLSPDLLAQEHLQYGFALPWGRSGNGQNRGGCLRNRPRRNKVGEMRRNWVCPYTSRTAIGPLDISLFFPTGLTLAHSLMFHTSNWLRVACRGLV